MLPHLSQLKSLHITAVAEDEVGLEVALGIPLLEDLTLRQAGIAAIPDAIAALSRLTALCLDRNPLEDDSLHHLRGLASLRRLQLVDCGLEMLPEWAPCLTALTLLDLLTNERIQLEPGDLRQVLARMPWLAELRLDEKSAQAVPAHDWVELARKCPQLRVMHHDCSCMVCYHAAYA